MGLQVTLQICQELELSAAQLTGVRLVIGVDRLQVDGHVAPEAERPVTELALPGLQV